MKKHFKFSDQSVAAKTVYGIVIAILCITAVVIGIVAAANRKPTPEDTPTPQEQSDPAPKTPTFVSPAVGTILTPHSLTLPVFNETLGEWRMHTGIDIATEEGAAVYASADGKISAVFDDPRYGKTVEITHEDGTVTIYGNLDKTLEDGIEKGKDVKGGDKLGKVGDTALYEIAEEAHLHFGVRVNGKAVDPLDVLSRETQVASLGL